MLTHMSPRERLTYAFMIAVLLGIFAYVGAGQLKKTPSLAIEPLEGQKAGLIGTGNPTSLVSSSPESSPEIVVHVVGAVGKAGLYRAAPGDRVQDAIDAQGGSLKDADLEEINLAARLEDGTQLLVPRKGKPEEVAKVAEPYRGGGSDVYRAKPKAVSGNSPKATPGGMVSLNSASQAQLESLPGIGPATAKKILEYRRAHGGFSSIEELMSVKGIGPKKLESVRAFVKL